MIEAVEIGDDDAYAAISNFSKFRPANLAPAGGIIVTHNDFSTLFATGKIVPGRPPADRSPDPIYAAIRPLASAFGIVRRRERRRWGNHTLL